MSFSLNQNHTHIMGIINVTPDSFSGDGILSSENARDQALRQAESMIKAGCHILDVGAESTRPGAIPLDAQQELDRLMPVVEALIPLGIPLSIDTTKANVAEVALQTGAEIINDVSGLYHDSQMLPLIVQYQCHVVIMHNDAYGPSQDSQNPYVVQSDHLGGQYVSNESLKKTMPIYNHVAESLRLNADRAIAAGLNVSKIIIDPGVGFNKTREENLSLLANLEIVTQLLYPLLLGASRKSFIGHTVKAPVTERLGGSIAAMTIGIMKGARIIRVHDAFESVQAAYLMDEMKGFL